MNFRKLAIAFAIALMVSGLCTLSLSHRMKANASAPKPTRSYVVPTRPLNADEVLKADSLTLAEWPSDVEVAGAFTKTSDVIGRTVLYPTQKGQPLTDKVVSAPGAGTGLAGRIPAGMRAIALRTDEVMGVAGFLEPGSRLDVLATYRAQDTPEPITVTVLQNAEVLAAGQKTQPDPDGKPSTVTVVTLLLSPEDAEKAVMASTQGTIHFVMRSGSDSTLNKSNPVLLSALTGDQVAATQGKLPVSAHAAGGVKASARRGTEASRAVARGVSKLITVQTILGDKQFTNTFPGDGR